MNKIELIKRYILFIVSLFISALGIAFVKHAGLGVSPISSIANILSIEYSSITLGTWLIYFNVLLILGQIVILRRNFKLIELIQLPLSFLFGYFTDIGLMIANHIAISTYFLSLIVLFSGIMILALGVALAVIANVVMNSGEAFVKAISDTTKISFGNVKTAFDISCVIISIALSLIFFDLRIVGLREGTVLSALLTGSIVKVYLKFLKTPLEKILI